MPVPNGHRKSLLFDSKMFNFQTAEFKNVVVREVRDRDALVAKRRKSAAYGASRG
jgi:hypothetical protein